MADITYLPAPEGDASLSIVKMEELGAACQIVTIAFGMTDRAAQNPPDESLA